MKMISTFAVVTLSLLSSVVVAEENMLKIAKPMYNFALTCEKTGNVAVLGEPDSDNVFQYSSAQIEPILALDSSLSVEEIHMTEVEMVNKGMLTCVNKEDLLPHEDQDQITSN
jgi:hypothetical protein